MATPCSIASALLLLAAAGFSFAAADDPRALLGAPAERVALYRWGALADLFGYYLLWSPLMLALRRRYGGSPLIDLYTAGGLAYVLVGAMGAVTLATVVPMLASDHAAASGAAREAAAAALVATVTWVTRGLWQTLEPIPMAVWFLGIGMLLAREQRWLGAVSLVLGAAAATLALARVVGAEGLATAALAVWLTPALVWPLVLSLRLGLFRASGGAASSPGRAPA